MNLPSAVRRAGRETGWAKIPWDDPQFSARMLREHLSQDHDAASRRVVVIEQHVAWIDAALLGGVPSRVLDLGCGPGFYTERLARRGHTCTGVDFGPAAIAYAREQAAASQLAIDYRQQDLRVAEFGNGYDLAMLIYGELNAFTESEAAELLAHTRAALKTGARLLLEVSSEDGVRRMGSAPRTWYSAEKGLFGDSPYLCLTEGSWDETLRRAQRRYYVVDEASGTVQTWGSTTQAYTFDGYRRLLGSCGFGDIAFEETFGGERAADFAVFTARA